MPAPGSCSRSAARRSRARARRARSARSGFRPIKTAGMPPSMGPKKGMSSVKAATTASSAVKRIPAPMRVRKSSRRRRARPWRGRAPPRRGCHRRDAVGDAATAQSPAQPAGSWRRWRASPLARPAARRTTRRGRSGSRAGSRRRRRCSARQRSGRRAGSASTPAGAPDRGDRLGGHVGHPGLLLGREDQGQSAQAGEPPRRRRRRVGKQYALFLRSGTVLPTWSSGAPAQYLSPSLFSIPISSEPFGFSILLAVRSRFRAE